MYSPRSLKSPRSSTASQNSPRLMVKIQKIDVPDAIPQKIRIPRTMKELLRIATDVLDLKRPAKRVVNVDGQTIQSIKDLSADSLFYISCVEDPIDKFDDNESYKSRTSKASFSTTRTLPTLKAVEPKPKNENTAQHQAIAADDSSVKKRLRDSLLSLYVSIPPEAKTQLSCASTLQQAFLECQQSEVQNSLLEQFIFPTSTISQTEMGREELQFVLDQIKGLKVEDCRFSIIGPSLSGKTTLLSIFSSVFFQKLQLACEAQNYLIFPINWLIQQVYFSNIPNIYTLFVKTLISGLHLSRKELIPILPSFQQWLLSLLTIPTQPPLPPMILHFPGFPIDAVTVVARSIHSNYNTNNEEFLRAMVSMPNTISRAFGMNGAIFIFDHFDCSALTIVPSTKCQDQVDFCPLLCEQLQTSPFFVAAQDEKLFYRSFDVDNFKQISTERLIKQSLPSQSLVITKPQMILNPSMTRGCPGYCAIFERLIKLAQEDSIIKSQFSKFRSVIDCERQEMLRQEVFRICLLLSDADSENNFQDETLNELMEMDEIVVKVK